MNVDSTLVAQAPKIFPHISKMKQQIAAALGVSEKQIGIKATTNEGLGFHRPGRRNCRHGGGERGFRMSAWPRNEQRLEEVKPADSVRVLSDT